MKQSTNRFDKYRFLWFSISLMSLLLVSMSAQSAVSVNPSRQRFHYPEGVTQLDLTESLEPVDSSGNTIKTTRVIPGTVQVWNEHSEKYVAAEDGVVIVQFKNQMSAAKLEKQVKTLGCTVASSLRTAPLHILNITDGMALQEKLQQLQSDPSVALAEPSLINYMAYDPNDPYYRNQYHHPLTQTDEAWDLAYPAGSGFANRVVVAVVDSGVDHLHEDLQDLLWRNEDEIPGNGIDDDGNGFIDDATGWDFYDNDNTVFPSPDGIDNDGDGYIDAGVEHGTHCAGIVAAAVDNGIGVAGVSWNTEIMAVRTMGDEGYGGTAGILEGIDYAVLNGADVVSLSIGGGYTDAYTILFTAVRAFYPHVVICAAAGNNGMDLDWLQMSPVCNDGFNEGDNLVIGVAASDRYDFKAYFSNYSATYVDITAPGVDIYSTVYYNPQYNFFNKYDYMSGTSMACPVVAGAVAVLKNVMGPDLDAEEAMLRLQMGADDIDLYNPGYIGELGSGRVNVYSMVESASDEIPPTPTPTPIPHTYPVMDLLPPYSEPVAAIGLDLGHPSGQTVLDEVIVRFESIEGSVGGFTIEDLAELTLDDKSGVALYKDRAGLTRGGFDWTGENSTSLNDILVPLDSIEYIPGRTDAKEGFRVKLDIDSYQSEAILPSSTDDGLFDYYIVIRSSGLLAHDDTVGVDIPPRGIRAIDRSLQQGSAVEFFEEPYPQEEFRKPIYGEIVQFINYTQPFQEFESEDDMLWIMDVERHPIKQNSSPVEVIGINAWGHPSHDYQLERVTVTVANVRDAHSDMFNPLASATDELTSSGIALYRDVSGTNDGVFDGPEQDEVVLLDGTQHWIPIIGDDGEIREWRVVLTPLEPQKLTVPPNDTQDGNVGADYFVVIRTSDRLRNLQTFRVEVGSDGIAAPSAQLRAMNGRVYLRSGDQTGLRTRREITNRSKLTSGERVFDIMARPVPEFTFHDVTTQNFITRESRTFPVIGIDMQDFGASAAYQLDRDTWSYVLRDLSFDVISDNPEQPVLPEYFRPLSSNRRKDPLFFEQEFDAGFALYWDDDTEIGDFMDEDEMGSFGSIGLFDEELLDHKDNDDDGVIDEDPGDGDPRGINGEYDAHDDYIPFYRRNYGFVSTHANNSAYVVPPTATMLIGEPGFQVKFNMIIRRYCESHVCDSAAMRRTDAGDMNNNEPFGPSFFRFGEWPVVGGSVSFTDINGNGCGGCGTCGGPYLWNGMGYFMSCVLPTCPTTGCNDRRISYDHFIEIPDDNVTELHGDDMYITLRTNHFFPNGMQFKVRVNSGAITYDKFHRIIQPLLYPGSSSTGVTSRPISGVIQIFNQIEKMFTSDKWIDYKSPSQNLPTSALGFNIDIGGSPESYEQEFSFEEIQQIVVDFIDEGGLQLSVSDPSASDLLPFGGDGTSGISLYFDNGSSFGALDTQDTAIGLISSSTKDLVKTDFGYRLTLKVKSGEMPVPFDDDLTYNGDGTVKYQNNGVDYFLCLRTSRNISFNDQFRVRLSSSGAFLKGTAQIQSDGAETVTSGLFKAAVPTSLTSMIGTDRIINDADLSPKKAVVGINFWDGLDNGDGSPVQHRTEYLDSLNVTIVPEGQGFKKTDLAPLSFDESSGVALYRDVDNPDDPLSRNGFLDPGDEFIEPRTLPNYSSTAVEGSPNAFQVSMSYFQGIVDVPDTDDGQDMGPDYFIVVRTSVDVENNQSFSVYMRPDQAIRYSSGSTSATLWTDSLITRINVVPTIEMVEPEELGTEPVNYQVQISWQANDPDDDAEIAIYYSTNEDFEGTLIEDELLEQDGLGVYTWDVRDVPTGTYRVFGIITDMDAPRDPDRYPSTRDYASGNVIIRNTPPTFSFVAPMEGVTEVSESYLIQWNASDLENDASITLYYTTEVGEPGTVIAGGLSENSVNEFLWRVNSVKPGTYYIYAEIDDGVNPVVGVYSPGQVRITFTNRSQGGFPVETRGSMFSSPVLYDFDGDTITDLAVGSDDGKLYVVNGQGELLSGFSLNLDSRIQSGPAVGDVVGGSTPEMVVASFDGGIYVIDFAGQYYTRSGQSTSIRTPFANITGNLQSSAALADLDGDGKKDIVLPDGVGNLAILYSDGTTEMVQLGTTASVTTPAIADIDGDGLPEIAVAVGNQVYVLENEGTVKTGYPLTLDSTISSSISLADMTSDPGLEMAFGTQDRNMHLISADGAQVAGYPVLLSSSLRASPVVTFFDDLRELYLIAATTDSTVYVLTGDGSIENSVRLGGHIYASPACADIVGATDLVADGVQEIIVATDEGKVFALDRDLNNAMVNGAAPAAFADVGQPIYAGLAIGDIDGDGDPEVVFTDNGKRIQAWDLIGQNFGLSVNAWPMFRHDPAHTGYLAKPPVVLIGDLNGDNLIDSADLFVLSERWQEVRSPNLSAAHDVNANNMLDNTELLLFVQFWHRNSE